MCYFKRRQHRKNRFLGTRFHRGAALGLLLCMVLSSNASAQEYWTLKDYLKQAVSASHEVRKAYFQQEESLSKTREVRAAGLPQLEGSLNYSRMGIPSIELPEGLISSLPDEILPLLEGLSGLNALHTTSAGVTVSQLLYSKAYLTGVQQVKTAEKLQQIFSEKTKEDLMGDVASLYYELLMNYAHLRMIDDHIGNLEQMHGVLLLLHENDMLKQTEVSRLQVTLANLRTQRENLENGMDIQNRVLCIYSGIPIERKVLPDTTEIQTMALNVQEVPEYVPERLPDYQLLEKQNELARLQVQSEKSAYWPTLAAFGQFTLTNYNTEFSIKDYRQMNTVGVKAVIPIFSSGQRKNRVAQAEWKLRQQEEDFQWASKQLETGYRNAVSALASARRNLVYQADNRQLAQQVSDQVSLQYREGMASLTDWLNVETSLLEADNLYRQQYLKYKLAEINVLKSAGKLRTLINDESL